MKKNLSFLVLAAIATTLVGCSSGGGGNTALDTAAPTANQAPTEGAGTTQKHSMRKPGTIAAPGGPAASK